MTPYPANEHHRISFGETQAVQESLTELKRIEAKGRIAYKITHECLPRIAGESWCQAKYRKWSPS
jgi:hypothetical protein